MYIYIINFKRKPFNVLVGLIYNMVFSQFRLFTKERVNIEIKTKILNFYIKKVIKNK